MLPLKRGWKGTAIGFLLEESPVKPPVSQAAVQKGVQNFNAKA